MTGKNIKYDGFDGLEVITWIINWTFNRNFATVIAAIHSIDERFFVLSIRNKMRKTPHANQIVDIYSVSAYKCVNSLYGFVISIHLMGFSLVSIFSLPKRGRITVIYVYMIQIMNTWSNIKSNTLQTLLYIFCNIIL